MLYSVLEDIELKQIHHVIFIVNWMHEIGPVELDEL